MAIDVANFGENILSRIPARWEVTNGQITAANIVLEANGKATMSILKTDIESIPEKFVFYAIADTYTTPYNPIIWGLLSVVDKSGQYYDYHIPIVNTQDGVCSAVLTTTAIAEYESCEFSFYCDLPTTFSEWILSAPKAEVNLDEIKEEIPRMLADYNTSKFIVGQREETIALISSRLLKNTDVGGKLQLTFVASQSCEVTIRFKDNMGTELFSPLLYEVPQGRSSVGVPHAYISRLAGIHTFTATAQCNKGTLTFHTRSIFYVIDAGHLAQRILDIGSHIYDLAVQQLELETEPSSIFAIGRDPDEFIRVRKRPFEETGESIWEPQFTLDRGKDAAIEFDGTWIRKMGQTFFTLACNNVPWVFIVKTDGTLYGQIGNDETTRYTLDTGVSQVSAIRGYKSTIQISQDQGLIVAYLKNGSAFYRNYCIQEDGATHLWEGPWAIPELGTNITELQVHRLNDYRIGFASSSPDGNKWLISKRTYINASTPPETIEFNLFTLPAIAIVKENELPYETPTLTTQIDDNWQDLWVISTMPLVLRFPWAECITIVQNSTGAQVKVFEIVEDNKIHIQLSRAASLNTVLMIAPFVPLITAVLPNGTYVPISQNAWVFSFSPIPNETIELSLNLESVTITPKYAGPIEAYCPIDTIGLNVVLESTSITMKPVLTVEGYLPTDTIGLNIVLESTLITPLFVGEEPI